MRLENSGGDVLARGGSKANFHGPNVSQEVWDAIWEPEVSQEVWDAIWEPEVSQEVWDAIWEPEVSSGDASAPKTGDGSASPATDQVCPV